MKIKGAIFDLDGTLLESMHIWENLGAEYLDSVGVKAKPDLKEQINEMTLCEAAEFIKTEYNLKQSAEEIADGVNSLVAHKYNHELILKDGAGEFLAALKAQGVRMCVATATDKPLVAAALKRNSVLTFFEDILTCTLVGAGKSQPVIYEKALEILKTDKSDTVVFEDAVFAAKTAKSADFIVCGMKDKCEHNQAELKKTADFYAENFKKAGEIFK